MLAHAAGVQRRFATQTTAPFRPTAISELRASRHLAAKVIIARASLVISGSAKGIEPLGAGPLLIGMSVLNHQPRSAEDGTAFVVAVAWVRRLRVTLLSQKNSG